MNGERNAILFVMIFCSLCLTRQATRRSWPVSTRPALACSHCRGLPVVERGGVPVAALAVAVFADALGRPEVNRLRPSAGLQLPVDKRLGRLPGRVEIKLIARRVVGVQVRHANGRRPRRLHEESIDGRLAFAPALLEIDAVVVDIAAVAGDLGAVEGGGLFESLNGVGFGLGVCGAAKRNTPATMIRTVRGCDIFHLACPNGVNGMVLYYRKSLRHPTIEL